MPLIPMQTNFTGGEWSPRLETRIDIEKRKGALKLARNGVVLPHGGFRMRGGTKYKGEVKDSASVTRLIPFIFNRTTAYALEFGDGYMRIWDIDGNPITSGGSPVELVTPYASSDLWLIQKKQSFDVCYFVHPNYPVYKLCRYSDTSWTFEDVEWQDGPYIKENINPAKGLTPSGTSGSITLTATNTATETTYGTWGDTVTGTITPFTGSNLYARIKFTAPAGSISLRRFSLYVGGYTGTARSLSAMLYTSSGGNPGTLIDSATNLQYIGGSGSGVAGVKTWNFNAPALTPSTVYFLIIQISVATAAVTMQSVAASSNLDSDYSTTPTATFSALGSEYRAQIYYLSSGNLGIFTSAHVGALFRLRHPGYTDRLDMTSDDVFTTPRVLYGKFTVDLTPNPDNPWVGKVTLQKSFDGGTAWYDVASLFYSTSQEFVETKHNIQYRVGVKSGDYSRGRAWVTICQDERWGVVRITEAINAYTARATVVHTLGGTSKTTMWAEGAWSYYRGFPATITCHEDRFYYAGTYYQPTTIWATWVGDYECFMPSDTAESALNVTFTKLDNPIQWVDSFTAFLMGTLGEEAWVKGSQAKPITSDNIDCKVQGAVGSCQGMRPLRVDSSLLFLQLQRQEIREMAYSFESDGYDNPRDLTVWAEHLMRAGIVNMAYVRDPDQMVWCVDADGLCPVLTYYRDEKVLAWSQHSTDGVVEDAISLPSGLGATVGLDRLWMIVKRTINGSTKRYIEILENNNGRADLADHFCVDCGITYSGTATSTITGLTHLNGKTVSIMADGAAHPTRVVANGQITLAANASKVHVGLPYTARLMPLKLEVGTPEGTSQGRIKRIVETTARFSQTMIHAGGPKYSNHLQQDKFLIELPLNGDISTEDAGDVPILWPAGYDEEGQVYIEQTSPCPMTVNALIYKVEVADA